MITLLTSSNVNFKSLMNLLLFFPLVETKLLEFVRKFHDTLRSVALEGIVLKFIQQRLSIFWIISSISVINYTLSHAKVLVVQLSYVIPSM